MAKRKRKREIIPINKFVSFSLLICKFLVPLDRLNPPHRLVSIQREMPPPPRLIFFFFVFLAAAAAAEAEADSDEHHQQLAEAANKGQVIELDESNFHAAISYFDYILVDFYAPWCGHCQRLSPELEKAAPILARLKHHPVAVAKLNADKYRRLASKHGISSYPTLIIFMHGVATQYHGPRQAHLLVRYLNKFVSPDVALLHSDTGVTHFVQQEADAHFPVFIGFGINQTVISDLAVKYKKKAWFSVAKDFTQDTMEFYDFYKTPALVALHQTYQEKSVFYGPFQGTFLEDYVKQSLLPLVFPINHETLKLIKDEERKIALTLMDDETDDKSEKLIKLLKAAASANRDLVFAYVGFKQFEEFAESFEFTKKTSLPKMVIWDGNEDYMSVIGSESIEEEEDQGTQITRFVQGYKQGKVIKKQISGPSFFTYLNSLLGIRALYIVVFLLLVLALILQFTKEANQMDRVSSGGSDIGEPIGGAGDKED